MDRRRSTWSRLCTTLAKLAFGLTVFVTTVAGWAYLRPSVINHMALPDSIPDRLSNSCALWFVGSSSIERWHSMQRDIPEWQTHNRGIGGARLAQIAARAARTTSDVTPAGIVLYAGENDIAAGDAGADAARTMIRLVQEMTRRWPTVPLFVVGLKPSPERWSHRAEQLRFNAIVRDFAASHSALSFLPADTPLLRNGIPDPGLYVDGVHLNDRGYALWSHDIRVGIDRAMPSRRAARCAAARGAVSPERSIAA